jgi:radical SAM protein with 4Fe4S-binding SPASM domain
MYKEFIIDNETYVFCVDDFEILKISKVENIERVIRQKEKDKISETKNINNDFTKSSHINMVGIDLVNGCNLNCSYCFISASSKKRKVLSEEKVKDLLNFLEKEKTTPITFFFAGSGEPTMNFNLMKQLPNLCRDKGFVNCTFDLTTNGTILTEEMINFLKQEKFDINISLDGNEEINDASRKYINGKGSFKDVYKSIKELQEKKIEFSCKTVLTPNNKKIRDVFSFFEENKIGFVFTIATNSFDGHYLPNIDDLDNFKEQMDFVVEKYAELIKKNNYIFADKILNDIIRIHFGDTKGIACGGSRDGFYMDIDGDLFPCSYHTSSKELSVGNIYTGVNYDKIIENKWYAQPVDNYETCRDCWMKYLCSGSCFAIKWLENNNTETPSEYLCKTYDIYWSAIIKLYILIYPYIINGENVNFKDLNDGR